MVTLASSSPKTGAIRTGISLRRLLAIVAGLVLAGGIASALFTVGAVFRLHVVLPVWDEWVSIADAQMVRAGTYRLADLARQYNEHRILLPRLFFLTDDFLFGMSGRFDLAVMFVSQAVNAAVLIGLMMRLVTGKMRRALLAGFVLAVMFSLRQEQNFTFGFQLQFTGVFTFAILAAPPFTEALDRFGTFGRALRAGGTARLVLAFVLCAASTYTMANGALAGFTLLALAIGLRAPWRVSLATALVSAGLAALYFHGLAPSTMTLSPAEALADPLAYPAFLAAFIGNMLGDDIRATQALGLVGLVGIAAAGVRAMTGRVRDPASAALLAIAGFALASACATTYGRIGIGIMQAFEGRYVETGAVFWSALLPFWVPVAAERLPRPAGRVGAAVLATVAAVVLAAAVRAEIRAWPVMVRQAAIFTALRDSLLVGLFDPQAGHYEIFDGQTIASPLAFLRDERMSLFAEPAFGDLGRPPATVGRTTPSIDCKGTVAAYADPALGAGGVRLRGAAWDAAADRPVGRVLIAGADGTVVGLGSPDRPVGHPQTWTGYAKAAVGDPLSALAVLSDGALCDLGMTRVAAP